MMDKRTGNTECDPWQAGRSQGDAIGDIAVVTITQEELDRLRDENAELKAVVDKLPKTSDGVPVTGLDRVWYLRHDDITIVCEPYCNIPIASRSACYSTREAAEAAKEKNHE